MACFQTCLNSVASTFKSTDLVYFDCASKENFAVTVKGFTCVSLVCRKARTKKSSHPCGCCEFARDRILISGLTKPSLSFSREFRKNGGKRFFALGRPSELKDSPPFPGLKTRNLAGKDIDLQKVFPGHVTLLLMWFRGFGETMCEKYRLPFVENFHSESLAQYYEINVVDGLFFKPFSRLLEKNLRKQRPKERHDTFLCYSGNTKQIKENFLENIIVGHAFLVDCNGRVRWKAHANPTDEEIKFMLDCSKLLLRETTRTLRENKAISSSR